ncbi:DUF6448 family protein [Opitutus sp. ER46]|uniref:DUF6448 family protein n=1 Tax=Opitutus sp. ER46 TaxID=2161864 RepID=UPI000D419B46|nr:DUF6448 family protein [Opitutus sp. ER46]PTY00067.1 hypothetical protein DB354_01910 [Opitutus sp. ER46]
MKRFLPRRAFTFFLLFPLVMAPLARAHCDTLSGPVVVEARAALAKGDVTPVLKWVKPAAEPAVREAFRKASAVRGQSAAVAELADTYFFETLVRLHREGEGEPFTGLKDETAEPGIAAADAALAAGSAAHLHHDLVARIKAVVDERFAAAQAARARADSSVQAGREYVAAYVAFMHLTEQLYALSNPTAAHAHGHAP